MNGPISSDGWPPSFTLDQERILDLLTGARFYSNASAALREAVLNSIDAVHRRRLTEASLTPCITVILNREDLTLTMSDNGDGMDRADMTRLFTRIGASAAQLETSSGSVGEFGIGVISYFMAGDSFSVQTFDGSTEPIGLKFTRQMLAGGAANQLEPIRDTKGTTLTINVRDSDTFTLLLDSFPHWCRDVLGLSGSLQPDAMSCIRAALTNPTRSQTCLRRNGLTVRTCLPSRSLVVGTPCPVYQRSRSSIEASLFRSSRSAASGELRDRSMLTRSISSLG